VSADTGGQLSAGSGSPDSSVLQLRREGRSFGSIAKALGFERSSQANEAFNRALRELPGDEQVTLRVEENVRLDALETRLRANAELETDEVDRRLRTIARLRQVLMAP
jgi:hypothetical protein